MVPGGGDRGPSLGRGLRAATPLRGWRKLSWNDQPDRGREEKFLNEFLKGLFHRLLNCDQPTGSDQAASIELKGKRGSF